tara:strand:- start:662 stop:1114 length:453 start_codon:yes stop_codon:yes gene_type:complete
MPTSATEAQHISEIVSEYLDDNVAKELFARLDSEIGINTENASLQQSLMMLRTLHSGSAVQINRWKCTLFHVIVTLHIAVIVINLLAFFILPFLYPIWVWMPINSFILTVMFQREQCPLTRLENTVRVAIGRKKIGGFIGHYFVKPFRKK